MPMKGLGNTATGENADVQVRDESETIGSKLSPLTWSVLGVLVTSAAVVLRLYQLEVKPFHHDEGVNAQFVQAMLQPPYTFRYDPANYHGPTLFYFGKASAIVFGLADFALRFVPAFFSIVTVLLMFSLRRRIGSVGALVAAALVAASPGAVYFGRYFIHESLLVCFTIAAFLAACEYHRTWRRGWLYLAAASLALMFATKETAIVSVGVMACAFVTALLLVPLRSRIGVQRPESLRADAQPDGNRNSWGAARRWSFPSKAFIIAAAIFIAINVAFYSSFFTHSTGVTDALRAFSLWSKTGTQDHVNPWWMYIRWFAEEEGVLLVLGVLGIVITLWSARILFTTLVALWGLGIFAAYSLIPYKTPWLTLNFVIPLAIMAGWAVEVCHLRSSAAQRRVLALVTFVIVGYSAYRAIDLNFVAYDDERRPYVYAHTSREVLQLVQKIREVRARVPAGTSINIAVLSPEHYPLLWYLRNYPVGYYGAIVKTDAGILLASQKQDEAVRKEFGGSYVRLGSYKLRPGADIIAYVRADLIR
jgi:uncharacterized protein (TIGR03663 family)